MDLNILTMKINDRDRYYQDDYRDNNRQNFDDNDYRKKDLRRQFERQYRNSFGSDNSSGYHSESRNDYDRHYNNNSYRSRDYEMEQDYYDNTRGNRGNLSNVRQGYGFTSFTGTSDRSNTLENMERERNAQREQGYLSGNRRDNRNYNYDDGPYNESRRRSSDSDFMNHREGFQNSGGHSDRGVPDYSMRSFGEEYGAGVESSRGNRNYSSNSGNGKRGGADTNSAGSYGDSNVRHSNSSNHNNRFSTESDRGGYVNRDPNY